MSKASRKARSSGAAPQRAVEGERGVEHLNVAHMAQIEASARAALRQGLVAESAYFRAERRGFAPGHELDDWLAAEIEVGNALQLTAVSPGEETALRSVS